MCRPGQFLGGQLSVPQTLQRSDSLLTGRVVSKGLARFEALPSGSHTHVRALLQLRE